MNNHAEKVIQYGLLVFIFWTVPFWLLGTQLEIILAWFCGAVGAKWLIFALMESVQAWPERTERVADRLGLPTGDRGTA